jgi:hypothetical protein
VVVAVGVGYGVGFGAFYSPPTDPYVLPTGSIDATIGGTVSGQLPFSVSLGYRPIPLLSFGVVLGYAPIFLKDCGSSCSGGDSRVGGELRLPIMPERPFSLWTSVGAGYERFGYSKDPNVDSSREVERPATISTFRWEAIS